MINKRLFSKAKADLQVRVLPENIDVPASHESTILETLLAANLEIDHSCGGMGSCGTCRVYIEKGLDQFDARNELEAEIAEMRNFVENERLSCQNKVKKGLVLRRP